MIPTVIVIVMVAVAAVGATFGLEGGLRLYKISSEATEHVLDHMVGPNAKNLVSNLSRQMPIAQMPRKAHKLIGIFMSDFDNKLRRGLNP
jgi:ribosomal 30S subunit maturation factor RimM